MSYLVHPRPAADADVTFGRRRRDVRQTNEWCGRRRRGVRQTQTSRSADADVTFIETSACCKVIL